MDHFITFPAKLFLNDKFIVDLLGNVIYDDCRGILIRSQLR